MKLLIADDHPLFRLAVLQALEPLVHSHHLALLETDSLEGVLDQLERHADIELVLLDLTMPGNQGLAGITRLRTSYPAVAVAVISAHDEPEVVQRSLALGALGFIPKSSPLTVIQDAVAGLLEGNAWVPAQLALATVPADGDLAERLRLLTPQQRRVLEMIAEGKLNKQIAWELGIQETTIKQHVSAILRKLGFVNRTQAGIALKQLMPVIERTL